MKQKKKNTQSLFVGGGSEEDEEQYFNSLLKSYFPFIPDYISHYLHYSMTLSTITIVHQFPCNANQPFVLSQRALFILPSEAVPA